MCSEIDVSCGGAFFAECGNLSVPLREDGIHSFTVLYLAPLKQHSIRNEHF